MPHGYVAPAHMLDAFNCPTCGTFAQQDWVPQLAGIYLIPGIGNLSYKPDNLTVALCRKCLTYSIWYSGRLVQPATLLGPPAHLDMPIADGIKADYEEARTILAASPRGAAALLRLVIQKLCKHLGEKGKDINTDIGELVKKGLPPQIQMALDIVRVVGNESVHPGLIDITDDTETANKLFSLVNLIVEDRISRPKEIAELYASLPEEKRKAIEKRDSSTTV